MVNEQIDQQLRAWCDGQVEVQLLAVPSAAEDVAATVQVRGEPPVYIDILHHADEPFLTARHIADVPAAAVEVRALPAEVAPQPSFPEAVRRLALSRPAPLIAEVEQTGESYQVRFWLRLYRDGLSQHLFLTAVAELVRTRELLDQLVEETSRRAALVAQIEAASAQAEAEARQRQEALEREAAEQQRRLDEERRLAEEQARQVLAGQATTIVRTAAGNAGPSIACTACGASLAPGTRFCTNCGQQVVASPTPPPAIGATRAGADEVAGFFAPQAGQHAAQPAAPPTCANCGAALTPGARFCTSCGSPAA